jgi:hypothetical protein
MDSGVEPGADFFDSDSSGDEGVWEDDNGTRDFSGVEGLGIQDSIVSADFDNFDEEDHGHGLADDSKGQDWRRRIVQARTTHTGKELICAMPAFDQIPAQDSRTGTINNIPHNHSDDDAEASPIIHGKYAHIHRKGTKEYPAMSLRRLGRVEVVHRSRSGSAGADISRERALSDVRSSATSQFSSLPILGEVPGGDRENEVFSTRHRRSTSDSIRADSILNAHVVTMRALESLSPTASFSMAHAPFTPGNGRKHSLSVPQPTFQRSSSTRSPPDRGIKLAPITTTYEDDPDRPKHLPDQFVKTPYPFSAKKEFPKPRTRPRKHDFDSLNGNGDERIHDGMGESDNDSFHDQTKGKHVLGIVASEGTFDLRSRAERNEDAQGVIRSETIPKELRGRAGNTETRKSFVGQECVLYVSLRARRGEDGGVVDRLVRLTIPTDLTTTSPSPEPRTQKSKLGIVEKARKVTRTGGGGGTVTYDFDDAFLATSLQCAYHKLAGNWLWRTFSARTLRSVRLGKINVWSGSRSTHTPTTRGLLSVCSGIEISGADGDLISPFTEHNLLDLYRNPKKGKARYTWVHWARRVAVSNECFELGQSSQTGEQGRTTRRNQLDVSPSEESSSEDDSPLIRRLHHPDSLTTIQFTNAFAPLRIIFALATILVLSVIAALLWIFLGNSAWTLPAWKGRSERVGPGMAVGALALILQMVVFVAWLVGSWLWV